MILLNPGPVTLSPRVRAALMDPDLCHREPEFADLQDNIRARLLGVYGLLPADYAAVLFTGSGTAAVEAMLSSLIPQTGELLVLENGVYGERLTRIAEIHRIPHVRVQHAGRPHSICLGSRRPSSDIRGSAISPWSTMRPRPGA